MLFIKINRTKLDFFCNSVLHYISDILFLTETWLNSYIRDNELGIVNYNIFRSDRLSDYSVKGSGVLLMVNHIMYIYKGELIITDKISNIKHIFVLLSVNDIEFLLICVYISHNSPYDTYTHFCELIESILYLHPNAKILLYHPICVKSVKTYRY